LVANPTICCFAAALLRFCFLFADGMMMLDWSQLQIHDADTPIVKASWNLQLHVRFSRNKFKGKSNFIQVWSILCLLYCRIIFPMQFNRFHRWTFLLGIELWADHWLSVHHVRGKSLLPQVTDAQTHIQVYIDIYLFIDYWKIL
jgi:hypothetical protein